jgi:hypothetical protein
MSTILVGDAKPPAGITPVDIFIFVANYPAGATLQAALVRKHYPALFQFITLGGTGVNTLLLLADQTFVRVNDFQVRNFVHHVTI